MQLTWLDNNSWLMEISGKKILLDPWLVGSLVFGNLEWLFKGTKSKNYDIGQSIDLIVLSQGLDDHAHIPTLKELDHNIPVVASPNAAKVVEELGYTDIHTLSHGEKALCSLRIAVALAGSIEPARLATSVCRARRYPACS